METANPMKDWLKKHDISYRALAVMLGSSPATVSQKVNHETEWQAKDLRFLFNKFSLRPSFVLGLTDENGRRLTGD
ncbi:XRE family transcriptional regulator [Bifidobacterium pseudolongum]|uniref:XRE family transcriptional regulator n=1 Tax=Bifidobacterium pseudolongum TaxID=1694 RepID=UPI001F5CE3DD|nr:XRE family transcriptional regulator [Bifidobacterium pseudolongum]